MSEKYQKKTHYKMYKAGKVWMFAGVTALTLLAGGFADNHTHVHADSTGDNTSDNDAIHPGSSATVAVSAQTASQGTIPASTSQPTSVHNTAANSQSSTSAPISSATSSANMSTNPLPARSVEHSDSPSLSYRIVDDSDGAPVSSFMSNGVEYDIDSAGTSYIPQDPAVIAEMSADNDDINYNNDDSDADDDLFDGTDYAGDTYAQATSRATDSDIAAIFAPQSSSDSINASLATTFNQAYQSYHQQNQSNNMTVMQLKQLQSQANAYQTTVDSGVVRDVTTKMSGVLTSANIQGDNLLTTSAAVMANSSIANSQSGQSFVSFANNAISQANASVSQVNELAPSLNADLQQFSNYVQSLADLQTVDMTRQKNQLISLMTTVNTTMTSNQNWLTTTQQAGNTIQENLTSISQQAQTWASLATQHPDNDAVVSQKAINDRQLASLDAITSQMATPVVGTTTERQVVQEASQAVNTIAQQINQLQLSGLTPVSATLASQTLTSYQHQLATLNDNLIQQSPILKSNATTLTSLAQQSDHLNTSLQALSLRIQQDANEDNDVHSLPDKPTSSSTNSTTPTSSATTSNSTTSNSSATTSNSATPNSSAITSNSTTPNSSANAQNNNHVDSHSAETPRTSISANTLSPSSDNNLPTAGGKAPVTATSVVTTNSGTNSSSATTKTSSPKTSATTVNSQSSTTSSTTTSTTASSSTTGSKTTSKTSTDTTQKWYRIMTAQTFVDANGRQTTLTPAKRPRVKIIGKATKTADGYVYNVKYAGKIGTITLRQPTQLQTLYYTKTELNDVIGRHSNMYVYIKHDIKKYKRADFASDNAVKRYRKGQVVKVRQIITTNNKTYFKLVHGGYITSNRYFVSVAK